MEFTCKICGNPLNCGDCDKESRFWLQDIYEITLKDFNEIDLRYIIKNWKIKKSDEFITLQKAVENDGFP